MTNRAVAEEWASWQLFHLAFVFALILGPAVSMLLAAVFTDAGRSLSVLEGFQAAGGTMFLQFTIGLIFVIPIYVGGNILGFPLWCFVMKSLVTRNIPSGLSMFCNAILTTYIISISTDLALFLLSESPRGLQFPMTTTFAPGVALVAIVSTQFLMVPAE